MFEQIVTRGRRGGATARARIEAAVQQHQAAIDKHRGALLPSDTALEPGNFAAWIRRCDSAETTREQLINFIAFTSDCIRSARPGRYTDIRTPYLDYAKQALARRFPESQPAPDLAGGAQ